MKAKLRILALALAVGSAGIWFVTGANRGWTKTSVPKRVVDDVTGLEGVSYQRGFVPGLDFLGVTLSGAILLEGVSWLFPNKKLSNSEK